ncbi:MAG: hypothetical protein JNJ57_13470 [Saprospiraceae bacterium]|nr:hypothetical protein [Saprospiraceae bacterium]
MKIITNSNKKQNSQPKVQKIVPEKQHETKPSDPYALTCTICGKPYTSRIRLVETCTCL